MIESALVSTLVSTAAVIAAFDGRPVEVYVDLLPSPESMPAIVVAVTDDSSPYALDGTPQPQTTLLQVTILATGSQAKAQIAAIAPAVRTVVGGKRGTWGDALTGQRTVHASLIEQERTIASADDPNGYAHQIDVRVVHQAA